MKKVGIGFAVIIAVGLAYFLICNRLGFGIPCLFHQITGFKCPGCGISRMCISLLKRDIYSAWTYNRAVLIIMPIIGYLIIRELYLYVRYNDLTLLKWERVLCVIVTVLLFAFGLVRNFFGW